MGYKKVLGVLGIGFLTLVGVLIWFMLSPPDKQTGLTAQELSSDSVVDQWPVHGGALGGGQCSPLTQINRDNVTRLTKVWEYQLPDHPMPEVEGLQMDFRANAIDAIVGEQFDSPHYSRDRMLTQPLQFLRGIRSGMQFIDLGQTQSHSGLMTETIVKSGQGN